RRITMVEVVDLPQPDSPTSPTLSPRFTVKLIPSTARKISGSGAGLRWKILRKPPGNPLRGYSLTNFSTRSSGVMVVTFGEVKSASPRTRSAPSPRRGEGWGEGVRISPSSCNPLTPTLSPNGERESTELVAQESPSGSSSRRDTQGRGV